MSTTKTSSTAERGANNGTVAQIFGPVVDVRFPAGKLPPINSALTLSDKERDIDVVLEVSQHLGNDVVRCVAMSTTGLMPGRIPSSVLRRGSSAVR